VLALAMEHLQAACGGLVTVVLKDILVNPSQLSDLPLFGTLLYLHKVEVVINVIERIYIECLAFIQYNKTIPILRNNWPQSRQQMYTETDTVYWDHYKV
jgi:hypothetical protein